MCEHGPAEGGHYLCVTTNSKFRTAPLLTQCCQEAAGIVAFERRAHGPPAKEAAMAHPVMWFEVLGDDGPGLQQFYGALFGWTFDVIEPIKYGMTNMKGERG